MQKIKLKQTLQPQTGASPGASFAVTGKTSLGVTVVYFSTPNIYCYVYNPQRRKRKNKQN